VIPRTLVLRALGLGDFLTGVPALRALRRALPGHELVLATPGTLAPLVELAGPVDRVLPTHGLRSLPWTGPRPEVAVNLHGRGPQSHRLLRGTGPARLVGFGCPEASAGGPPWDQDEHEVVRWCRLVAEAFDVPTDPDDLRLDVPRRPPPVTGAVVLHVGAASPARRWPEDRFAEVARWARGTGHPVVVTGSADEVGIAERVQHLAGLPAGTVLAGRTDLEDLAGLVARAALVVSGDTGVAHLASAYGTPSVVLFGPTPPSRWGPPASGPHTVIWHGSEVGDPAADEVDPALLRVTVAEVVAAADVRARAGRPAPTPEQLPAQHPSRPAGPPPGPGTRTTTASA
jgi:ADP-heptose:LPS heptosyltransferase